MPADDAPILICSSGSATSSRLERWLSGRYSSLQRCFVPADLDRHFEAGAVSLVIVDVSEGQYELLRVAHRLRQRSGAPTVVVAAGEVATDRPLSTLHGADSVLFQPMSETATVAQVQLLMQLLQTRRDLTQARVQLDALALSRQNGLALLAPDGSIAFHNKGLATLFGYTPDQLRRVKIWDLATPAGRKTVRTANTDLKDDPHGTAGAVGRWQRRDGALVDIEIDAHRYFDGDDVGGLIFEARSIADELALRQVMFEQPLANADAAMLISRMEELKAEVETLDALAETGATVEVLRPHVTEIRASMERLMASSVPVENVDVIAIVQEVLEQHARQHLPEDSRIEVTLPPRLPAVRARATELRRILANFLADAVTGVRARANSDEPGYVRVAATVRPASDAEPARLVLTIEDNGISAEHFLRYDNRASMRLNRARSRISIWGGSVVIQPTADDYGALVTVELLVSDASERRLDVQAPGQRDILLVEDEVQEHQIIGATLQRAGYRVTGVADARAAERVLYERPFDLIIIDANVPEAASERGINRFRRFAPEVPVVLIGAGAAGAHPESLGARVVEADDINDVLQRVEQALR
jgi:PAS domain S-box-containing protein